MTTSASYRDKDAWLQERKTGIGGSDAAVILGVSPYRTLRDLWLEKTGQLDDKDKPTPAMIRGIHLEPVAADLYVERTGRKVRRQPMKRHPKYDWMIGNVDRQILAGGDVKSTGILEVKCPGLRVMSNVKAHGLPDYMVVQLTWYLAVYGYSWGSFVLFNSEQWDLIYFDLEADQQLIDTLIARGEEFWIKYVIPGIEPPSEAAKATDIPKIEGELTTVDSDEWVRAATEFREARELKDTATELEETAKARVQELMHRDELHAAEVPGLVRFYYKPFPGNTKWKPTAEAIAREARLNVDDFIVKGDGYTKFTPYLLRGSTEE
jgi:putative phage-type endonuclease